MVEFMYCGETTVSHQYLSSLLDAAKIFKVKELVSVIDTIVGTKKILDNFETCLKQQTGDCNLKVTNSSLTENDYVRVRCDKLSMENASLCADSNNDACSTKSQSLESLDTEHDSEHTLYDESDIIDPDSGKSTETLSLFTMPDVNINWHSDIISSVSTHGNVNEVQMMGCTHGNGDETSCNNSHDLKPMLYEQCCDLSEVSEHDQTSYSASSSCSTTTTTTTPVSQSCLSRVDDDLEQCFDRNVPLSKVGKCVKVYTHKRRKSVDEIRNKLVHTQCNLVPTPPPSTDSIDLLDEPSTNNIPVTLLTSLDMESDEYILSLSTESIQSIVGSTISDQHTVIGCKKSNARSDNAEKERLSPSDADYAKPVLRRSTRLNQQESDETASNGGGIPTTASIAGCEKPFKKGNSPNRTELYAKAKRKGREDRKVLDHYGAISVDTTLQSAIKKSLKSKKSNSKLMVRKSSKSACAMSTLNAGKEKEESKPKATTTTTTTTTISGIRNESTDARVISDRRSVSPMKLDTISGIDRALWGDNSDRLTEEESETNSLVFSPNNAIPFAVGLLPLRTALEKMQATPDYQPRKTRSSFAPSRQESVLKRKANCVFSDVVKKQGVGNNAESPKTVCHIQIKAAPSQDVKNRKSRLFTAGDGRREQAITQVS
ncbi:uncharacterized protein LOC116841007 isoform X2 [Odontomachus brunneus]|nr:uncharacterized protein LOC116841007 isoform X2 [Odontomachus brunneus]XP_032664372.1 uncharacterized protein LOC116841007 isoform X2 [Odontomachus brunneus]XP_032664379.1 uncharacterized protein LOC116841007 isoform X2 [Odontomachus brunneus]XP_032664389.1 uncharacterized protein LOC116841007 isoform X2 [Odontomachus brunneus]XP_032664399.1 uncharacterized protein LOC116841007 isoform X2 [Odontomachus brunneus]XP_032664408.1 uncharacterized protein LOC116841007 isoform X2 [Odontomachus bru